MRIEGTNFLDASSRGIATHPWKFRLAHVLVRVVAILNLTHLLLLGYQPYFQWADRFFGQFTTRWIDVKWMLVSSFLIPLYVGLETWWMFRDRLQKRALVVDWVIAVIWFATWWAEVLYSLYKYYPYF